MARETRHSQLVKQLILGGDDPKKVCDEYGVSCELALRWVLDHVRYAEVVDYDAELPTEQLEGLFDFGLLYRIYQLPGGSSFLLEMDQIYSSLVGQDQHIADRESKQRSVSRDGNERSVVVRQKNSEEAKQCYRREAANLLKTKPHANWNRSSLARKLIELLDDKKIECPPRKFDQIRQYLS